MKIKELRALISTLDDNAEVMLRDDDELCQAVRENFIVVDKDRPTRVFDIQNDDDALDDFDDEAALCDNSMMTNSGDIVGVTGNMLILRTL